jgi:hypothetical protein
MADLAIAVAALSACLVRIGCRDQLGWPRICGIRYRLPVALFRAIRPSQEPGAGITRFRPGHTALAF